jgi:quinolinate synthase
VLSDRKKAQKKRIEELKDSMGALVFSHFYQRGEVKDLSDYVGGTRGILREIKDARAEAVVLCAVGFLSDAARRLRPDIAVLVPRADASCPYGEAMGPGEVALLRKSFPEAFIAAGIKTREDVLGLCDAVLPFEEGPPACLSGKRGLFFNNNSANPGSGKILTLPGLEGLAELDPAGEFLRLSGLKELPRCQIHAQITKDEIEEYRREYPRARILVNILSDPEVRDMGDFVSDADGLYEYVEASLEEEFLIVSETGLAETLRVRYPGKKIRELETEMFCPNMKLTNIKDILYALEAYGEAGAGRNKVPGLPQGLGDGLGDANRETGWGEERGSQL